MAYTAIPAAGGISTVSVDATMSGDGSVGNPLHAIPTFGSDTTISINNAVSSPVTALEVIASLTANAAGAEASQWLVKLLVAGAQVDALTLKPNQAVFRAGTGALPGVAVGGTDTGMSLVAGQLVLSNSGLNALVINAGSGTMLFAGNYALNIGSDLLTGIARTGTAAGDLRVYATRDVVIGADGALATSAVAGLLQIPTCAGTPTGNYTPRSGKVAIIYDTTNEKLSRTTGGANWKHSGAFT